MARSNYMREALATFFATKALYYSAHSSDPGITGAGELSGGTYARGARTAVGGSSTDGANAGSGTVNIPAGGSFSWIGFWDASSGGNYVDSFAVTTQTYATAGTYAATDTVQA
jgi:hypothetical protein